MNEDNLTVKGYKNRANESWELTDDVMLMFHLNIRCRFDRSARVERRCFWAAVGGYYGDQCCNGSTDDYDYCVQHLLHRLKHCSCYCCWLIRLKPHNYTECEGAKGWIIIIIITIIWKTSIIIIDIWLTKWKSETRWERKANKSNKKS